MDKSWMTLSTTSDEYVHGVENFIEYLVHKFGMDRELRCPCRRCLNGKSYSIPMIRAHLFVDGIDECYKCWIYHGEEPTIQLPPIDRRRHHREWEMRSNIEESEILEDNDFNELDKMLEDVETFSNNQVEDTYETNNFHIPSNFIDGLKVDSQQKLYPDCNLSKFEFIVKLLHLKVYNKWSNKSFDMLLELLRIAMPNGESLPKTYYQANKYLRGLGMGYHSIHVCKFDCCLFWGENKHMKECPICGTSRYKINDESGKSIPQKVLRYFPLKPRLQRFYMDSKIAQKMRWHKEEHIVNENFMGHPADGKSWKSFDMEYVDFAGDARNVRLALASDGFNPFGSMSLSYSMWPVVLLTYNLPPWMCMKKEYMMMSLLIPGPKAPGKEIDIYMQPLIDELKDLWVNGLQTYDAFSNTSFKMRAALMWTINDFPAYANLSGWSTKGYHACPTCQDQTPSLKLKNKIGYFGHRMWLPMNHRWRHSLEFDGDHDYREAPIIYSEEEILHQLSHVEDVCMGKHPNNARRPRSAEQLNWTKKSIFFKLPYWPKQKLRHNLDVMHIEKNICENLIGTILQLEGKTKDTLKARLDLEELGIRKELHLVKHHDGKYTKPCASYALCPNERKVFCQFLKGVRLPDGYASHIGRCVNDVNSNLSGMKSHDCHIMLQRLLPVGIRGMLPKDVASTIIELGSFFERLCRRILNIEEVQKMQRDIVIILCKLEQIFPPAFFDVMVHLAIHLPHEALMAGPVAYRWMYPIERFLGSLKKFVRNKAHPEGSIAEAYVVHECLTWCSLHLHGIETSFNRSERNFDSMEDGGVGVFKNRVGFISSPTYVRLEEEIEIAKWYILNNCHEVLPYLDEHIRILKAQHHVDIEQRHKNLDVGLRRR